MISIPNREQSLRLLADVLEEGVRINDMQYLGSQIERLWGSLHDDALDVLANVSHFVDDADIRERDEEYRRIHEADMRELIDALREGRSREELMNYTFLG